MGIRIAFKPSAGKYYGGTREGEAVTLQQRIGGALFHFFKKTNECDIDITVNAFYICNTGRVKVLFSIEDEEFRCFMSLRGSQIDTVYAIKSRTTISQQSLQDYFAIESLETDCDSTSIP